MCKPQSKSRLRSEWEVLDEIEARLTRSVALNSGLYPSSEKINDNLLIIKNLLNELKSSMIERNRR